MNNKYDVSKILTERDIETLNSMYIRLKRKDNSDSCQRYHNLYNVNLIQVSYLKEPELKSILDKLFSYTKQFNVNTSSKEVAFENSKIFFLEYSENSFAQMHTDNISESGSSLITLIYKSEDLVGGDILIAENVDHFPDDGRINRGGDKRMTSIAVLNQDLNTTAIYKSKLMHGVSKVFSGTRRVFCAWF